MHSYGTRVETASRDHLWLCLVGLGHTVAGIARHDHKSRRTVQLGLKRARGLATTRAAAILGPELVLFFPINGLRPDSHCRCTPANHRAGSVLTCSVCHRCGCDGCKALARHPGTDPKPDPRPKAPPDAVRPQSRRQRRARLHHQPG
jgi:hypothetical protein